MSKQKQISYTKKLTVKKYKKTPNPSSSSSALWSSMLWMNSLLSTWYCCSSAYKSARWNVNELVQNVRNYSKQNQCILRSPENRWSWTQYCLNISGYRYNNKTKMYPTFDFFSLRSTIFCSSFRFFFVNFFEWTTLTWRPRASNLGPFFLFFESPLAGNTVTLAASCEST